MTEIKLYKSPWKAVGLIIACSIFVLIGIWGIKTKEMPSLISWLCVCFFGLGYPVGFFNFFDKRPQIIINEFGIFDRTTHKDFINWEIIKDAYPIDINGQKFICLVVEENFKPSKAKSHLYRRAAKFNEIIGAQELNISLGQIRVDYRKLTEFILQIIAVSSPNRAEVLIKGLNEFNKNNHWL